MELTNKRIILLSIYWIVGFSTTYFVGYQLVEQIRDLQISLSKDWFNHFINDNYVDLKRFVEVNSEVSDKISYNIIRPDTNDYSINEIKTIEVELFDTWISSMAVGLAFCFASPVRIKKKFKISALVLGSLILANSIKHLAIVYDNYNFPEFSLINDLPVIISQIVYAINWFLAKTGSISASVILPALIWIIIMVSDAEVRKIFSDS